MKTTKDLIVRIIFSIGFITVLQCLTVVYEQIK
jgi:hypothetical protein